MRAYRKERVASVIRRVVGEAIAHRLSDPRVAPLTTVTRVTLTGDLLIAKVYLSVRGDGADERRTLAGVRHASGFIQRMVAKALPIRHCPGLRFEIDQGTKGARRTLELLAENRRREPESFESEDGGDLDATEQNNAADEPSKDSSELNGDGE
jgi:ribosome-binding factor A